MYMTSSGVSASAAGSITIGDGLRVNRLGYGAMQLTGLGVWGKPKDPDEAIELTDKDFAKLSDAV